MKDKERLLSPEEPRRFTFRHSAIKEGWDNPNVFQIRTLRETGTETERRQTLGRGLRLARDAEGAVVHDPLVNLLTVVCNERFEDYAKALQSDIADATGIKFGKVGPDAFKALSAIVDDGVTYHRIDGLAYEQRLFHEDDSEEITAYASRLYEVQDKSKALYDVIEWKPEVERDFAKALDDREEVKLFFKLSLWLIIPTSVGPYNPDWPIVTGNANKVYLVRETKSASDPNARRDRENQKIKFGRRHLDAISAIQPDAVDFKDCVTLSALAGIDDV